MKFIIPQKEDLTREVIKEEFFKKYYPEMKVRQGWWYIFGRYVMLQKNPFVCAKFTVKQNEDEGKTHIRIEKDQNMWAYILAAPIVNTFIQGDFYNELYRNFSDWLTKKYALSKDEIILTDPRARTKFYINVFLIAAIIVGILLLIFDQISNYVSYNYLTSDNYSPLHGFLYNLPTGRRERDLPYILLMFGAFSGIIYYFMKRKKDERNEKIERILGLKIQTYKTKNKKLKPILSVIKWICLYVVLFILVALIPNLIDNMRPRDFIEKELPACVNDIIEKEKPGPSDYFNIEYLTPDILWVIHDDKDTFYDLDGKPANNLTVWAFKYKNSVELFAIIAAILLAFIYLFWRKKKEKNEEHEPLADDEENTEEIMESFSGDETFKINDEDTITL